MAFVHTRAFLVTALLLSAGLAGGAGVALVNATDDSRSSTTATPTTSPSPEATPTPAATADATPTATPEATASAAPTAPATASATGSPSVTATSASKTYAYPRPTRGYDALVLTVTNNPGGGSSDTTFDLTVKGSDGDGTIYFSGLTWGDGSSVAAQSSPQKCKSYPPLTSPPGAYQPEPDAKSYLYHHRYPAAGRYVIKVSISSVNADCKPHGPSPETRSVQLAVTVTPGQPTPSPLT